MNGIKIWRICLDTVHYYILIQIQIQIQIFKGEQRVKLEGDQALWRNCLAKKHSYTNRLASPVDAISISEIWNYHSGEGARVGDVIALKNIIIQIKDISLVVTFKPTNEFCRLHAVSNIKLGGVPNIKRKISNLRNSLSLTTGLQTAKILHSFTKGQIHISFHLMSK